MRLSKKVPGVSATSLMVLSGNKLMHRLSAPTVGKLDYAEFYSNHSKCAIKCSELLRSKSDTMIIRSLDVVSSTNPAKNL